MITESEIENRVASSYELPNNVQKSVPEPLVTIRTSTFQHKSYIKDCIEGVIKQKTEFPFEFIIGEDCSTDGTREIVFDYAERFPNVIRVITSDHNVGSKANSRRCVRASRGKYMALCEGDDFWIDSLKLQKQVQFLEENPDFSMCFHAVKLINGFDDTGIIAGAGSKDQIFSDEKLFYSGGFHSPTTSILFLKKFIDNRPDWVLKAPVGDVPFKLFLSQNGKIKYFNDVMAARRIAVKGSWNDRTRNSISKSYDYHTGMMLMIDRFNMETNYKYNDELLNKKLLYLSKIFKSTNFNDRVRQLKNNIEPSNIWSIKIITLLKVLSMLFFPRLDLVYKRLFSSKY